MAFDRPIDADRVDNLGFISSFLRAPIIGPLIWLIGGRFAKEQEARQEEEDVQQLRCETASLSLNSSPDSIPTFSILTNEESNSTNKSNIIPDILSSDLSEEDLSTVGDKKQQEFRNTKHDRMTRNDGSFEDLPSILKKNRKTSWSDESGQHLVEYCDEAKQSSTRTATTVLPCKPMKSAIRRSTGRTAINPSQYIPSGMSRGEIATTRDGNPSLLDDESPYNGYISPQWGWYISGSTTPPTPDRYFAAPPRAPSIPVQKDPPKTQSQDEVSQRMDIKRSQQNTIGTLKPILKKSVPKDDVSGWPSVPL